MRTLVTFAPHQTAIEQPTELGTSATQWHGIVSKKTVEPDSPSKPWLAHYPESVPATLSYPDFPIWGFLTQTAAAHPHRIACQYYEQQLTFAQLAEDARRVAAMLVKFGLRPGDRVGILMPNMPEYISAINGVWMAGGCAVALSPLSVAHEIANVLTATDCRIVISLDLLAPLVLNGSYQPRHLFFTTLQDRLPGWMRLGYAFARMRKLGFWPPVDGPNQHDLPDELALCRPLAQPVVPASLSEAAYILPTGGTTGAEGGDVEPSKPLGEYFTMCGVGQRRSRESDRTVCLAVLPQLWVDQQFAVRHCHRRHADSVAPVHSASSGPINRTTSSDDLQRGSGHVGVAE